MPRKYSRAVDELMAKARSSTLLAVATFNNPTLEFRYQAFVMLMHTAWTSLLLSILLRKNLKPFYRKRNGYQYEKLDGERKAWDLSQCVRVYWENRTDAVKENLHFFIRFRNKIEHFRDQATLAKLTFGECQSYVTNLEDIKTQEFGGAANISDRLYLSIQLSSLRDPHRNKALLSAVDKSTRDIVSFIDEFRSSLGTEIYQDMRYSFKAYLVPKTVSNMSKNAAAIEWITDVENISPEQIENVDKLIALIKGTPVEAKNVGKLMPTAVCTQVRDSLGLTNFSAPFHHSKCWKFYKVRPLQGASNPMKCRTKYCQYDDTFKAYVYTQDWADFLIKELKDPDKFRKIMSS